MANQLYLFFLFISDDNLFFIIKNKGIEKFLVSISANDETSPFKPILKKDSDKSDANEWKRIRVRERIYFRLKNRVSGCYLNSNSVGSVFLALLKKDDKY
jgi:hypothetical protein